MKNESLKDTIYSAILEDIFSMEYRPGAILNEKSLVEKYNCSKSPVREALITLCNENVLRNIPRYGYEVVRLTMDDVSEMLQFRYILEGGMLSERHDRITDAQLERLEAIDAKCRIENTDVWKHWEYNTEFHLKLIGFCGSNYALEELTRCMARLKRAYAQFYWDKWNQGFLPTDTRHHAQILDFLRKRDIEQVLHYLKDDLSDFGGLEQVWF
jgi:DNA-binding GntR family transcriptional regulator